MRRITACLPLLLALFVGETTSVTMSRIVAQPMLIRAEPVALDSHDPARTRVGALTLLGGWRLTSNVRAFGGLSALDMDGNRATAISDIGAIVTFRVGGFGHISDARILPLPSGCGGNDDKTARDTESLAHDARRQHWWIGFEWRNAICRTDANFATGRAFAPPAMRDWPRTTGPETLLTLRDGTMMVLAERGRSGRVRPLLLFHGDPVDPHTAITQLGFLPPQGYSPTDAAQLPDGRILILTRKFSIFSLFTARLVIVDPARFAAGAVVAGQDVARLESPVVTDNYEGVSVTQEQGRTIVWIVSDDNYMGWQRTLLLKFALDG